MEAEHDKSIAEKMKAAIRDLVGLPPGDGTPHGAGRPANDEDSPSGTLTAPDADVLEPFGGTGIVAR